MDNNMLTTGQLVEYANTLAKWSLESGDNLMYYLNTLAKCSTYSLNNQLVIMGYKSDAQYLKGWDEWPEFGVNINPNATVIPIIEPINDGYHVKYMCDVSDTDYAYEPYTPEKLIALEALLSDQETNIEVVDDIKNGVRAMYKPEENLIMVKRSSQVSPDVFFTSISAEKTHMSFNRSSENSGVYKRATNQLTATAVAYALGVKYGMDVSNIKLNNLPEKYTKLSDKGAKNELQKISLHFNEIDKGITMALENIKKREGIVYER